MCPDRPVQRRGLGEEGSVTIEAAFSLSALVVVAALIIAALATVAAHVAAVDMAGAAARAHAIGVEYQPPRGQLSVSREGGLVKVEARVPAPLGWQRATAVFPVEYQGESK